MLFAARGFRIALLAQDGFSKLLAVGLTFCFTLQTFIIVGGIVRIIPLTGITLPFVSYGGSSVVANFVLLAGFLSSRTGPTPGAARESADLAPRRRRARARSPPSSSGRRTGRPGRPPSLEERQDNAIKVVAQFTIKRGVIYAGDGVTKLAVNRRKRVRRPDVLLPPLSEGQAHRPRRRLFDPRPGAHRARALAQRLPDRGEREPQHHPRHEARRAGGKTIEGNDIITTIRWRAQKVAMDAFGGNCGAAVALEPRDGQGARPRLEPDVRPEPRREQLRAAPRAHGPCAPSSPLLDRATAGLFIPGSTFKVVTATAALDSGRFNAGLDVRRPRLLHRVRAARQQLRHVQSVSAASTSPRRCSTRSTRLLQDRQGARPRSDPRLRAAFGFYEDPPVDRPADERAPSGLYENGVLFCRRTRSPGRSRPPRVRPGADARDPAADGHGRGGRRQRRRRDGAVLDRSGRAPRWLDRHAHGAGRAAAGNQGGNGAAARPG